MGRALAERLMLKNLNLAAPWAAQRGSPLQFGHWARGFPRVSANIPGPEEDLQQVAGMQAEAELQRSPISALSTGRGPWRAWLEGLEKSPRMPVPSTPRQDRLALGPDKP